MFLFTYIMVISQVEGEMRQQRAGWKERVGKVYMRRCNEGKYADKVTQELWAEWKRADKADKQWAYAQSNPEIIAAKEAVARAVAHGDLVRPSTCSRCGKERRIYAHHHSYAPEDRLDVKWVCQKCHRAIHDGR